MLPAIVLACLVLTAGLSGRRGLLSAVALAAMSVLWLMVNRPMEGPVLLVLGEDRGVSGADLAGLAGLVLAAHHVVNLRRLRGARSSERSPVPW